MPRILVNYRMHKDKTLELKDYECVFSDIPIAIAEYDYKYDDPVLVNAGLPYPLVVERSELLKQMEVRKNLKQFKFKINQDQTVVETEETPDVTIELPKDTDVSKLRYINNQIVMFDEEGAK